MVPPHFIFLRNGIFLLFNRIYAKKGKEKEEEYDIPLLELLTFEIINHQNELKSPFRYHINIA